MIARRRRRAGSGGALKIARVVNLLLAGALTGTEFGSRTGLHPALSELPPDAHLRAEQTVTRRYGQIMPVFMTVTVASFGPVLALAEGRTSSRLAMAGMLCYAAMLGVTFAGNVPINRRTLELDAENFSTEEFLELRRRWNRFHTARNVLNLAGLSGAILAALERS